MACQITHTENAIFNKIKLRSIALLLAKVIPIELNCFADAFISM